eukprot:7927423-Lingulodinium_polyedra.AAC.1
MLSLLFASRANVGHKYHSRSAISVFNGILARAAMALSRSRFLDKPPMFDVPVCLAGDFSWGHAAEQGY